MGGKAPSRAPTESSASPWLDMDMEMGRWRGMRAQRSATLMPRSLRASSILTAMSFECSTVAVVHCSLSCRTAM